jgi:hypothetical protein
LAKSVFVPVAIMSYVPDAGRSNVNVMSNGTVAS